MRRGLCCFKEDGAKRGEESKLRDEMTGQKIWIRKNNTVITTSQMTVVAELE